MDSAEEVPPEDEIINGRISGELAKDEDDVVTDEKSKPLADAENPNPPTDIGSISEANGVPVKVGDLKHGGVSEDKSNAIKKTPVAHKGRPVLSQSLSFPSKAVNSKAMKKTVDIANTRQNADADVEHSRNPNKQTNIRVRHSMVRTFYVGTFV